MSWAFTAMFAKISDLFLCYLFVAVMQTEGFKYVEETCPPLLSELLETIASVAVDERSSEGLSRKRSGSSIIGLDLAATAQMVAAAESADTNARRMRRRL